MSRRILLVTFTLVMLTATAYSCGRHDSKTAIEPAVSDTVAVKPEPLHLSLLFAGDLMQHGPQIKAALQSDGTYNYDECFARVHDVIEGADVAIANFEVTLGGKPYAGYPQFRAPDEYLEAVINAGFDVLLTANNHCLDSHRRGFERTIQMMDSLGVPHLGTYVNAQAREQQYPFLLEKNGFRVVLLNFTYGTNGLAIEHPNVVNLIDTAEIARDIVKARDMRPDLIIALPHWGIEYQTLPSPQQRQLAQWLIDHGVDHVIGGHPHVAQPIELMEGASPNPSEGGENSSSVRKHLVAWSMGNVISNQSKPNTYGGYMVRLDLQKDSDVVTLDSCGYTLYWVSRPPDSGGRQYRILPVDEPDSLLTPTEQRLRDAIRQSMRQLMERHNVGDIREYLFSSQ